MKQFLLPVLAFSFCLEAVAQKTKPTAKPAAKPATKPAAAPALRTLTDSASYAIGVSMASFYKQQGLTGLNTALISRAINDVYNNKPTLLDEVAANACMNTVMIKMQEEKVKPNVEAGEAFLAENKKRPGVKTTSSGLQYEVITEGQGIKPTELDTFVAHYRGTLVNGTQFDASYDRGQPLTLPVRSVIRGWTEGLQLMSVGSRYKFYIPQNLAYGPFDNNGIPGGSALIFDVELVDVKKHH